MTLQIEQDPEFERRESRFQRATWFALLAVMAATLAGAFGSGPASRAQVGDARQRLEIEYERFGRVGASTRIVVHARPDGRGKVEFVLPQEYLESVRVGAMTPEPRSASAARDGVRYEFDVNPPAERATVVLDVEPIRPGSVHAQVSAGDSVVRFRQFFFP